MLTEYVLEHVRDLTEVLTNIRTRLAPGGMAVHVLPNLVDRHDWYVSYRLQSLLAGASPRLGRRARCSADRPGPVRAHNSA